MDDGVYTVARGGYIVDMNGSPILTPPFRAIRRLTALWALVAVALPVARGPLCASGAHETGHSAGAVGDMAAHAHGPALAHGRSGAHGGEPDPPRVGAGLALDETSTPAAGCHRLNACGAILLAIEWPDVPASAHPSLALAACGIGFVARSGPSFSPTPPPPRA